MDLLGKTVLIAGASSSIAKALLRDLKARGALPITLGRSSTEEYEHCQVDLAKSKSVKKVQAWLEKNDFHVDLVIHCAGILHEGDSFPEKQISEIDQAWFFKSLEVNVLTHIHLAQALDTSVKTKRLIHWISLSAMVGSLSDNHLGGWHSYRMSKAALNMFIKGLSIEWSRHNKQNCIISLHPGTTESPMSKPFKVAKDKLYSAELTAERISAIISKLDMNENGAFLNWDGTRIPY